MPIQRNLQATRLQGRECFRLNIERSSAKENSIDISVFQSSKRPAHDGREMKGMDADLCWVVMIRQHFRAVSSPYLRVRAEYPDATFPAPVL